MDELERIEYLDSRGLYTNERQKLQSEFRALLGRDLNEYKVQIHELSDSIESDESKYDGLIKGIKTEEYNYHLTEQDELNNLLSKINKLKRQDKSEFDRMKIKITELADSANAKIKSQNMKIDAMMKSLDSVVRDKFIIVNNEVTSLITRMEDISTKVDHNVATTRVKEEEMREEILNILKSRIKEVNLDVNDQQLELDRLRRKSELEDISIKNLEKAVDTDASTVSAVNVFFNGLRQSELIKKQNYLKSIYIQEVFPSIKSVFKDLQLAGYGTPLDFGNCGFFIVPSYREVRNESGKIRTIYHYKDFGKAMIRWGEFNCTLSMTKNQLRITSTVRGNNRWREYTHNMDNCRIFGTLLTIDNTYSDIYHMQTDIWGLIIKQGLFTTNDSNDIYFKAMEIDIDRTDVIASAYRQVYDDFKVTFVEPELPHDGIFSIIPFICGTKSDTIFEKPSGLYLQNDDQICQAATFEKLLRYVAFLMDLSTEDDSSVQKPLSTALSAPVSDAVETLMVINNLQKKVNDLAKNQVSYSELRNPVIDHTYNLDYVVIPNKFPPVKNEAIGSLRMNIDVKSNFYDGGMPLSMVKSTDDAIAFEFEDTGSADDMRIEIGAFISLLDVKISSSGFNPDDHIVYENRTDTAWYTINHYTDIHYDRVPTMVIQYDMRSTGILVEIEVGRFGLPPSEPRVTKPITLSIKIGNVEKEVILSEDLFKVVEVMSPTGHYYTLRASDTLYLDDEILWSVDVTYHRVGDSGTQKIFTVERIERPPSWIGDPGSESWSYLDFHRDVAYKSDFDTLTLTFSREQRPSANVITIMNSTYDVIKESGGIPHTNSLRLQMAYDSIKLRGVKIPNGAPPLYFDNRYIEQVIYKIMEIDVRASRLELSVEELQMSVNNIVQALNTPAGVGVGDILSILSSVFMLISPPVGLILQTSGSIIQLIDAESQNNFGYTDKVIVAITGIVALAALGRNKLKSLLNKVTRAKIDQLESDIKTIGNSAIAGKPHEKLMNAISKLRIGERLKRQLNNYKEYLVKRAQFRNLTNREFDYFRPHDEVMITRTDLHVDFNLLGVNLDFLKRVVDKPNPFRTLLRAKNVAPEHASVITIRREPIEETNSVKETYNFYGFADYASLYQFRNNRAEAPIVVEPSKTKRSVGDIEIGHFKCEIIKHPDKHTEVLPFEDVGLTSNKVDLLFIETMLDSYSTLTQEQIEDLDLRLMPDEKWRILVNLHLRVKVHGANVVKEEASVPLFMEDAEGILTKIFDEYSNRVPYTLFENNCQLASKEIFNFIAKGKKPKFMTDEEYGKFIENATLNVF